MNTFPRREYRADERLLNARMNRKEGSRPATEDELAAFRAKRDELASLIEHAKRDEAVEQ